MKAIVDICKQCGCLWVPPGEDDVGCINPSPWDDSWHSLEGDCPEVAEWCPYITEHTVSQK